MMYVRMIGLVAIFDRNVALRAAPVQTASQRNPLELSTATLFAVLLVVMAVATHYAMGASPALGVQALAVIAGLTDIEPFVISLLQMRSPLSPAQIVEALVIATAANNMLKALCALIFAQRNAGLRVAAVLSSVAALSLGYLVL